MLSLSQCVYCGYGAASESWNQSSGITGLKNMLGNLKLFPFPSFIFLFTFIYSKTMLLSYLISFLNPEIKHSVVLEKHFKMVSELSNTLSVPSSVHNYKMRYQKIFFLSCLSIKFHKALWPVQF